MADFDKNIGINWLTEKERLIQITVNIFLFATIIDFISIVFKPIRDYHFAHFPNLHFIGVLLLFAITVKRIFQAYDEGKDVHMDMSRDWRERKGMLTAYDIVGPGPDYSHKRCNIVFFIISLISICLIIAELIKNFW